MRRLLIFVAVVWSVAGSFVAFEILLLGAGGVLLGNPRIAESLALSTATRDSTTCDASPDRASLDAGAWATNPDVRFATWTMGLKLGRDAIARQYSTVDRRVLDAAFSEAEALAVRLQITPPRGFIVEHALNANVEFFAYVEGDAQQTAGALTARYAPEACHLYKLGLFWGYASLVRGMIPGDATLFGAEMSHHARRAALPEELWVPMTERTTASDTSQQIWTAGEALTRRINEYLADPQRSSHTNDH